MSVFEDIAIPLIAVISAMLFFWIAKSCVREEPVKDGPKLKPHQIYAIVLNPSGSLRLGKMGLEMGLAIVGEDMVRNAAVNNASTTEESDDRSVSQESPDPGGGGGGGVVAEDSGAQNDQHQDPDEMV
ncbi:hypothetical protein BSKO_08445 [Bryopsis sp. KO-2023]|nr:hypothetical protein BSKO_08445 [Bryopsis sp. KO-2023]